MALDVCKYTLINTVQVLSPEMIFLVVFLCCVRFRELCSYRNPRILSRL